MKDQFVGVFSWRRNGLLWAVMLALFIGQLFSLLAITHRLFGVADRLSVGSFGTKDLLVLVNGTIPFVLIFLVAAYIAESDWVFIVLLGVGNGLQETFSTLLNRAIIGPQYPFNYLIPIWGFAYGILLGLFLVLFAKRGRLGVFGSIASFFLPSAILMSISIFLIQGIKSVMKVHTGKYTLLVWDLVSLTNGIIIGILFFIGLSYHSRKIAQTKTQLEFSA